jgi:hypothetical protein
MPFASAEPPRIIFNNHSIKTAGFARNEPRARSAHRASKDRGDADGTIQRLLTTAAHQRPGPSRVSVDVCRGPYLLL